MDYTVITSIYSIFFALLVLLQVVCNVFPQKLKVLIFSWLYQVQRKIDLVYGGGSVGLMGLISQTVFSGGCHVLGYVFIQIYISVYHVANSVVSFMMYRVIPKALQIHEVPFLQVSFLGLLECKLFSFSLLN